MEVLTAELSDKLFGKQVKRTAPLVKHRFHGANTPTGVTTFIPKLISDVNKCYFLKGRLGTGKSTILKQLSVEAEKRGLNVEIYYNGFKPNVIDLLIVRELNVAICDSAAFIEPIVEQKNDVWIDLESLVFTSKVTAADEHDLELITQKHAQKMQAGTEALAKAKRLRDRLEGYYIKAMDFTVAERISGEINAEIKQIAQRKTNETGQ